MTKPLDISRLKELAQAAPPGPWNVGHIDEHLEHAFIDDAEGTGVCEVFPRRAQAYVAAANPAVVLELLARLEASEQLNISMKCRETFYEDKHQLFGNLLSENASTAKTIDALVSANAEMRGYLNATVARLEAAEAWDAARTEELNQRDLTTTNLMRALTHAKYELYKAGQALDFLGDGGGRDRAWAAEEAARAALAAASEEGE